MNISCYVLTPCRHLRTAFKDIKFVLTHFITPYEKVNRFLKIFFMI